MTQLLPSSIRSLAPIRRGSEMKLVIIAGLLAVVGFQASGQSVTLKYDDGDGISGELIEFANDVYKLQTSIGLVTIPAEGISCIGLACPESERLQIASAPITLTSHDGSAQLSGDLLEVVDGQYVVASDVGEVRIDIDLVTCDGDGCPEQEPAQTIGGPVVLTSGSTTIEGELLSLEPGAYIVETANLGTIRVSTEQFDCSGPGCPTN